MLQGLKVCASSPDQPVHHAGASRRTSSAGQWRNAIVVVFLPPVLLRNGLLLGFPGDKLSSLRVAAGRCLSTPYVAHCSTR